MIFNPGMGKIYDTAFFLTDYFYDVYTEKKYLSVYEDTDFMIKCLHFLRERTDKLPDYLSPFALVRPDGNSSLIKFLQEVGENYAENLDLETVNNLFINEKESLFNIFIKTIFGDDADISEFRKNPAYFITEMEELSDSSEFKLKVTYILNDFDYAVKVLADYFNRIYNHVSELHKKYEKEILYAFEQIKSGLNLELYSQEFSYSPEKYEETYVAIPLVNQFAVSCHVKRNKAFMLLGYRHTGCFWNRGQTKPVDAKRFIVTAGNDIRVDLIDLIAKYGKITISTLSKIMDIPITTVGRHVGGLRNDNIIYISKRDGLQLFYSINTAYFKRLKNSFDNYVDKTVALAEKNKNKQKD